MAQPSQGFPSAAMEGAGQVSASHCLGKGQHGLSPQRQEMEIQCHVSDR